MSAAFSEVIENQNGYFADGWQYPLFFMALVLLLVLWKKKEAGIFFVFTLVAMAVIYCPVSAWVIMKAVGEDVYYRLFWVLPILYVLAAFMVEMFPLVGKKFNRIIASILLVALFAGLMFFGGHMVYERGVIGRAHNLEKLPPEVLDICDYINEDYESDGTGEKRVTAVGTIVPYIRQYDATILLSYGRNTVYKGDHTKGRGRLYMELTGNPDPDYDFIEKMLEKTDSKYLVLADTAFVSAAEMENRGYSSIYDNGSYTVMKRNL